MMATIAVLILTGQTDLPHHDWRITAPFLRQILERDGRFEVRVAEECRGLTGASLSRYDVLLLHYNGPRWGAATEQAVEEFVRSGKGLVAIHGVSYGPFFGQSMNARTTKPDQAWPAYAEMLGASWKMENIGHSARHVFPVKWTDREHRLARGLAPEFPANDELYHKIDLKPSARVLATAYSDPAQRGTGREEPMLWTVPYGRGRVVHTPLGHDLSAMVQPGFVQMLRRSVEWAASGAVQPEIAPAAPVRALAVTGGHGYPASFYSLFEGQPDLVWVHSDALPGNLEDRYDTVVLHDMKEDLPPAQRQTFQKFIEAGKGVVSIHHAIVNYTAWPWFWREVTGGKYFVNAVEGHAASQYKEGIDFVAVPVAKEASHPVLRGVPPLPLHDEVYRGMWHAPGIRALMETAHPANDRPVVYLGPHRRARAVYIQMGHSDSTMRHPGYRRLVRNAILWTAGRN